MLAAIRRLFLGSGSATSRGMASAANNEAERLFACLFPGQRYSPDRAAALASRLREVADTLEVQPMADEPEEPLSKKRRKELRGRGGWGGQTAWRRGAQLPLQQRFY